MAVRIRGREHDTQEKEEEEEEEEEEVYHRFVE
jgi:hypothetical protein